jgi:hypothetical protein
VGQIGREGVELPVGLRRVGGTEAFVELLEGEPTFGHALTKCCGDLFAVYVRGP